MGIADASAPVNSRLWWEDYFRSQWADNGGREQSNYFMGQLVACLPAPEREFLNSHEATILDWGCAFGDGVDVLAKTFPKCQAIGLDFAERAITEARRGFPQHEFRHTKDGEIGDKFDVIVTSACLEHFADPLTMMRQHLHSCRRFYVALVPYRESPLNECHVSQFREECFPEQLEGFTRLDTIVFDADHRFWPGQMILVVYASHNYCQERRQVAEHAAEKQKWDAYYASIPEVEIDGATRAFGEDLSGRIHELLPEGSRVLEAGCGAGWQSLVLAEAGKLRVSLMDFSEEALRYAQQSFARQNLTAEFAAGDVFAPAEPEYDLVFNAGVLEHYAFDEQVAFLRGMASRSQKYVLALVPNRMCYWYWLWRMHRSGRGDWPFGKEMPMVNLANAFEAAGLRFLGHWFGGAKWSEFFISSLTGIDDRLRDEILAVHRSAVIPEQQRAYLVAALGCKGEPGHVPPCWTLGAEHEDFTVDQLTASTADALAAVIGAEHRHKQLKVASAEKEKHWSEKLAAEAERARLLEEDIQRQSRELTRLCAELADQERHSIAAEELARLKNSRGYRCLQAAWRTRTWLVPPRSLRARIAKAGWNAFHGPTKMLSRWMFSIAPRRLKGLGARLAPSGTLRGRLARGAAEQGARLRARLVHRSSLTLEQILDETRDRKGIVVYPPFIDWTWMRQRPHQLMAAFAEAGYLALFCSPKSRTDSFRGYARAGERLYLCDQMDRLYNLSNPAVLVNWTGHWETTKRFRSPTVIYDYLDDLGVSSANGTPDRLKLELHRKLVTKSEIVLATARRLHEEVKTLRPDALYCPNGVDYTHFHLTAPVAVPSDITDLVASGRPIIGYYGALARWFDYDLLAHAATIRKDCEFLLIGPDFDHTFSAQRTLRRMANVRWVGEKKYEELPAYLHYFDVATIPFLINDITRATSPVKLFEYMAAAKPIVTTGMPECRAHSCVLAAGDAAEFVAMLDEAIHRGKVASYRRLLDQEAWKNTWNARVRQIIDQIDAVGFQERLRSA